MCSIHCISPQCQLLACSLHLLYFQSFLLFLQGKLICSLHPSNIIHPGWPTPPLSSHHPSQAYKGKSCSPWRLRSSSSCKHWVNHHLLPEVFPEQHGNSALSFLSEVQQEPVFLPFFFTPSLLFSMVNDIVLWTDALPFHHNASLKTTLESWKADCRQDHSRSPLATMRYSNNKEWK